MLRGRGLALGLSCAAVVAASLTASITYASPSATPSVSHLVLYPATLSPIGRFVNGRCLRVTRKDNLYPDCVRPVNLHISFKLDEPATVVFTLRKQTHGRYVARGCVKPTRHNRNRPVCAAMRRVPGAVERRGRRGRNHFTFGRKFAGHALTAGIYELTVTPSAHGVVGTSASGIFSLGSRRCRHCPSAPHA